jgi:hypothetical protein
MVCCERSRTISRRGGGVKRFRVLKASSISLDMRCLNSSTPPDAVSQCRNHVSLKAELISVSNLLLDYNKCKTFAGFSNSKKYGEKTSE